MKKVLLPLLALVSTHALAFDARDVYEQKYAEQPSGVYQDSGHLFFVVKQACEGDKKYSGTKESKLAEKTFYQQLLAEASLRRVSFDPNSISLSGQLKKDVLVSIGQQYDAKALISHQLLFDRDNGSCLREYVQVADATQFEQEKIQVPADTAEKVRNKLLLDAMEQQDLPLLASYMRSLDLTNLESVYAERTKAPYYAVDFQLGDDPSAYSQFCEQDSKYCPKQTQNTYQFDFNSVLDTAFSEKGIINLNSIHPRIKMSSALYANAKSNFDSGKNPAQIELDLTLSLNANANNPLAWQMLSSLYRATNKPQLALYSAQQYLSQQPFSTESWVYLLAPLRNEDQQQAQRLHDVLSSLAKHAQFSPWAQNQIKVYQ